MEEQKKTNLVLKSNTYDLIIPLEVERKIRLTCEKVWNTEWSGTLFYNYEGSFKDNNLKIICKDIFIMDIGSETYTEFDMNPSVISYMTEHPELLECQIGLIHSHNNMPTFFSGTDTATLQEEGKDRNNFVSLIVNNKGTYTAAITRRVKEKQIEENINYEFFGEGETKECKTYNKEETIEYFYLNIKKESESYSFPDLEQRLEEIRKAKEEKKKKTITQFPIISSTKNYTIPFNTKKESKEQNLPLRYEEYNGYDNIPYGEIKFCDSVINSLVKQLITCSIAIPDENKVDIDKWVKYMPKLYSKRFGNDEHGLKLFREWASFYIEFLTMSVSDPEIEALGFNNLDCQSICAYDLMCKLEEFSTNKYLEIYIEELNKYIV